MTGHMTGDARKRAVEAGRPLPGLTPLLEHFGIEGTAHVVEDYPLALEICRTTHPTRWEFRKPLGSCDECCDIAREVLVSDWLADHVRTAIARSHATNEAES